MQAEREAQAKYEASLLAIKLEMMKKGAKFKSLSNPPTPPKGWLNVLPSDLWWEIFEYGLPGEVDGRRNRRLIYVFLWEMSPKMMCQDASLKHLLQTGVAGGHNFWGRLGPQIYEHLKDTACARPRWENYALEGLNFRGACLVAQNDPSLTNPQKFEYYQMGQRLTWIWEEWCESPMAPSPQEREGSYVITHPPYLSGMCMKKMTVLGGEWR